MHGERRNEPRIDVSGMSWIVRLETTRLGTPMQLDNISPRGAAMSLTRDSPRAERMLRAAMAGPLLVDVADVPFHGPRPALVCWRTTGRDGRTRFGLEWIERLEHFDALVRKLGESGGAHESIPPLAGNVPASTKE